MSKYTVCCDWEQAPHLTREQKDALLKALLPHEISARSKGLPSIGSGAIYPISEHIFTTDPFKIPDHYSKWYGLDVGFNFTAATFMAYSHEEDIMYVYAEYVGERCEPAVNAAAIRARSQGWLRGVIDPASMGVSQSGGRSLLEQYERQGLSVDLANNSVEPGIYECYQRLGEGRLVIFNTCVKTLAELRLYRRDRNGKPVKKNDHLMDAMRYAVMTGEKVWQVEPAYEEEQQIEALNQRGSGSSSITGY